MLSAVGSIIQLSAQLICCHCTLARLLSMSVTIAFKSMVSPSVILRLVFSVITGG